MKELGNFHLSYKDIAQHNHVSTTLVQCYFDSFVNFPRLKLPTNIVIDELHSSMTKYGSSYLCVLVDNE
ncbi:MAG: ISL3 family transposase, partial [Breznakia sp.]